MTDEPPGLIGRLLHKKFTRREMIVNGGVAAGGLVATMAVGPTILDTISKAVAPSIPAAQGHAVPAPEAASANMMIRDFGLVLKGLSANPPLEEGMLYYRTDRQEYRGSVDGATTKTFLHEIQIDGVPTAQRSILNIIGGDALEDPVNKRINITFPPGLDSKVTVLAGGVVVGSAAHRLNFSNANDVTAAEDSPGNKTDVAVRRNVANGLAGLGAGADIADAQHGSRGSALHADSHAAIHAIDGTNHTGVITDAQHGARTVASAHRHSDLGSIGTDDHHAKVHADAEHSITYEKQSNKGIASGYASLDGSTLVPTSQLGSGTADNTKVLYGDRTWGALTVSPHTMLSATHSDTTPASVARGDIMAGVGASPKWERVALGATGRVLHSDGTDIAWTQLTHAELGGVSADQHHAEVHVISGADHTGVITDAQHGVRTEANAHAHADLSGVSSDQHHAQLHKAAHVSGGGDAFVKGDILIAAPRYLEAISDPVSDSQRIWMNVGRVRYWSNEGSPVKHDLAALDDALSGFTGGGITDAQHGIRTLASAHALSDLSGSITDTQHGVRTLANAHAHSALSGITANDHHAQLHKAAHISGGGDAFAKGDVLIAAAQYLDQQGSDPASDSRRIWIPSAGTAPKFWSDEGTPVKHTLARIADALSSFTGGGITDAQHGSRGAIASAHAHTDLGGVTADQHHAQSHGNTDHTTTGTPGSSAVGDAAAQGSSASVARLDHVHGREAFATPGIVLGSSAAAGSATTLIRSNATIAAFDATVPTSSAMGDAAAVGSAAFAARRDHLHGREAFATPGILLGSAAAAGTATTPIRSDSTIAAFDTTAPTTSAVADAAAVGTIAFAARRDHIHGREAFANPGSSAVGDSVNGGSATTISRSDHRHGRESFATPAIVLGSAAAAGSATTPIRSDSTIAAFDTTAPTNSAVGDAAAVGTIAFAARRDHVHGREAFVSPAIVLGSAAAAGSATTHIRSDATIAAFDTTAPTTSAVADAAAVGTIAFAARRDHVHGREAFAAPVKVTPAALSAAGVATTISRSDHAHQAPGGVARIVANVAIANTETAVITWTPGANFLIAGTTVRITGMGILTSGTTPGTATLNVRCGTNATTGTVASTTTVDTGTSQTNIGFWFEAILTVRTTGASGTCYAQITFLSNVGSTTKVRNSATTATAVVDTTSASTIISLSMISGNAGTTYTWNVATMEVVHMG